jgi:hypothetical protein
MNGDAFVMTSQGEALMSSAKSFSNLDDHYPKSRSLFVKQEKFEQVLASGLVLTSLLRINTKAKTIRITSLRINLGTVVYKNNMTADLESYTIENLLVHPREDYRAVAKGLMDREELQGKPEEDCDDPDNLTKDDPIEVLYNKILSKSWA